MKINFKSPFLWIGAVFLICCVGYLRGGRIVAGIVCGLICAGLVFLSFLVKPNGTASQAPPDDASVQVPEVSRFVGQTTVIDNVEWDLSSKYITKNGKDWFDVDKYYPSASGLYALCDGCDSSGNFAIALISRSQGVRIRRTDGAPVEVYVTDDGTGYALLDDNTLLVIDASSANIKKLSDESSDRSAHLLCPVCCIIAGEDGDDKIHIDAYDYASQRVWHKNFSAEYTGGDIILSLSGDIVSVSYNGITKRYRINGESV